MKKTIYSILLFIMFIGMTNAAKCNVISGTGKNIGDEIACGTEHFYVVSNDGVTVKLLSKYNLLAGMTYEKVEVENKEYSTPQEFYNQKAIKEKLEQGYLLEDEYESGDKLEVIFKKYTGYDYTTLISETKTMTLHEYLKSNEVQNLFNQGYELENRYRTNIKYNSNQATTADYFGGEFSKSIYYENKIIIFDEPVDSQTQTISEYLNNHEEYQKLISEGYLFYEYYSDSYSRVEGTSSYNYTLYSGVSLYKNNDIEEKVYQSEKAIGAHGDEQGKPIPIEVGIIEPMYMDGEIYGDVYSTYFYDFEYYENDDSNYYLESYYNTLKDEGYNVISINTLTVKEINELVKKITSEEIPLATWYETSEEIKYNQMTEGEFLILGSIKDLLSDKYNWIWSTTYWLRTTDNNYNIFFIDTLGDLCSSYYCQGSVGAGIRPVIEISATDLIYNVKTKTDGNGTIESTHIEAEKGEVIKFTITPNEGYVLSEVRVTDEEGNIITFTENTFTMPEANVIIEATFIVENSDTSTMSIFISCCLLIIFVGIYLTVKYLNELKWMKN